MVMAAVAVMMMPALYCLGQILNVGELPALRGAAEIRGKLIQLAGGSGITIRLRGLRGALQSSGDLLRHLLILSWIGLLQLLQRAKHLRERGKRIVVLEIQERGGIDAI